MHARTRAHARARALTRAHTAHAEVRDRARLYLRASEFKLAAVEAIKLEDGNLLQACMQG
jgi:hypothetical protein